MTGEAKITGDDIQYIVRDGNGLILTNGTIEMEGPAGTYNVFTKEISFSQSRTIEGTIEMFYVSASDGSRVSELTVPVYFELKETTVKIFFMNSERDPESLYCNKTYYTQRTISANTDIAWGALERLLAGPSQAEQDKGFYTSIPAGVRLKSLVIDNGIATADFDQTLQQGVGGSCRVSSIRAQIVATLKQFSFVDDVIISVNGRTGDVLQP